MAEKSIDMQLCKIDCILTIYKGNNNQLIIRNFRQKYIQQIVILQAFSTIQNKRRQTQKNENL